jgi:peptide/nickel transport system ATP-binding protein
MTSLIQAIDVNVSFSQPRSLTDFLRKQELRTVQAVSNVSFSLEAGETLGIVGESGCGKTTLGRALLGLVPRTGGQILLDGQNIDGLMTSNPMRFRSAAQMVFQDPFSALNPKLTVGKTLAEALRVHRICPDADIPAKVAELLETVGLSAELANRRPRALSGGQCQRIGIARALAVEPRLIVADESVSALDVSVQAQILNLLLELQRKQGLAMIFISHDLSVVRHICKKMAVMYLGRVVEVGDSAEIFANPRHPYTRALMAARPKMNAQELDPTAVLPGEPPSPVSMPAGCAFHPRCQYAADRCRGPDQPLFELSGEVKTACFFASRLNNLAPLGNE